MAVPILGIAKPITAHHSTAMDGYPITDNGTIKNGDVWIQDCVIADANVGTHINAAVREVQEETGLVLDLNQVMMTEHRFSGLSPKGRHITGKTCWTVLTGPPTPPVIKFNGELSGYEVLPPEGAVRLLKNRGMKEAKEGLVSLLGEIG